jgi:hypothetical protein
MPIPAAATARWNSASRSVAKPPTAIPSNVAALLKRLRIRPGPISAAANGSNAIFSSLFRCTGRLRRRGNQAALPPTPLGSHYASVGKIHRGIDDEAG